jgi:uncharacterized protein (TIGR02147 family)
VAGQQPGYRVLVSTPEPFHYLDYRAWLRDWYDARKRANPRFSHRQFVRRTGQRSPSLLADVMGRRRNLTPDLIAAFTKALSLSAEEARFFELLVELDQATDKDARQRAWDRISASRRFKEARKVEGDSYRYVAEWFYPAIRELARRGDFRPDPGWIAETLAPRITPAKAREALDTLFDLGMLSVRDDGAVVQTEGAVVTPPEVAGLAAHRYHQGMVDLAKAAIDRFAPGERHFVGVTVAIPAELVPRIKQEIDEFAQRLLDLCDGAATEPTRVVQLNLQLFPLSTERSE